MQGIESHVRERLLLERIEQLQAEHQKAEEADKTAKEKAFRCMAALESLLTPWPSVSAVSKPDAVGPATYMTC